MTAAWRGRLGEQPEDPAADESRPRGREARLLLAELLRPYRAVVAVLAAVVIIENAARLAGRPGGGGGGGGWWPPPRRW